MTPERNYGSLVLIDEDHIIHFGGDLPSDEEPCCGAVYPQHTTGETWEYSITARAFHTLEAREIPLKRHVAAKVGESRMCIATGFHFVNVPGQGQIWNEDMWCYDRARH